MGGSAHIFLETMGGSAHNHYMTRIQLITKLRRYARRNSLDFILDKEAGKGSHYQVILGGKIATIKSGKGGQLRPGYISLVMKQLGLPPGAL